MNTSQVGEEFAVIQLFVTFEARFFVNTLSKLRKHYTIESDLSDYDRGNGSSTVFFVFFN